MRSPLRPQLAFGSPEPTSTRSSGLFKLRHYFRGPKWKSPRYGICEGWMGRTTSSSRLTHSQSWMRCGRITTPPLRTWWSGARGWSLCKDIATAFSGVTLPGLWQQWMGSHFQRLSRLLFDEHERLSSESANVNIGGANSNRLPATARHRRAGHSPRPHSPSLSSTFCPHPDTRDTAGAGPDGPASHRRNLQAEPAACTTP